MQPYATDSDSLGSAEEPYDSDMTHSYRLTEGRLIRYPLTRVESEVNQRVNPRGSEPKMPRIPPTMVMYALSPNDTSSAM